jgi:TPR repeat protein
MRRIRLAALILPAALLAGAAFAQSPALNDGMQALAQARFGEAVRVLGPLAQQGNPEAQYAIGTMYANGDGLPQDVARAERLFRAAAAQGHEKAREQIEFLRAMRPSAPVQTASAVPSASIVSPAAAATIPGAWRVQLGTVANADVAQSEFKRLSRRFGEVLDGAQLVTMPFTMPDGSGVVRIQAGPYEETRARDVCARLRELNTGCLLVKPEG